MYNNVIFTQSTGKILVLRESEIIRLNEDLTEDVNFSPYDTNSFSPAITVLSDDSILVGTFLGIVKLQPNGTLDEVLDSTKNIQSLQIDNQGKLVVVVVDESSFPYTYNVERLNLDGSEDVTFSSYSTPLEIFVKVDSLNRVLIASRNFVETEDGVIRQQNSNVIRLGIDGNIDTGFNLSQNIKMFINGIYIQPDNKILIAGQDTLSVKPLLSSVNFPSIDFANGANIVRINTDGSIDDTFQVPENFKYSTPLDTGYFDLKILDNGYILLAPESIYYNENPGGSLILLRPDGSRVDSFNDRTLLPGVYSIALHYS